MCVYSMLVYMVHMYSHIMYSLAVSIVYSDVGVVAVVGLSLGCPIDSYYCCVY